MKMRKGRKRKEAGGGAGAMWLLWLLAATARASAGAEHDRRLATTQVQGAGRSAICSRVERYGWRATVSFVFYSILFGPEFRQNHVTIQENSSEFIRNHETTGIRFGEILRNFDQNRYMIH